MNNNITNNIEIIDTINDNASNDYELNNEINKINKKERKKDKLHTGKKNISKRKLNIVINLDTVIYEVMGSGENKTKNYDKISLEIKNIENKNEIEKAKLRKKIDQLTKRISDKELNKIGSKENEKEEKENIDLELFENKINLQSKKLIMLELEKNKKLNYIEVIQKLKIPPENRTIKDILRIKTYIEQSNLGKNFYDEFSDINIIEKLINFCSIEMRYIKFEKGDVIYRIGEPPNSFYSIIFGKANVLKPIEKHELLTGFQYFKYLMNLRKKKDNYVINLCIKNNIINYYIDPIHEDIIHYIYLNNYLDYIKNKDDMNIEFDKILDLIDIKPEELGLNPSKINSLSYINNNIKNIKRKIPPLSEVTIQKYSFINNYIIKKEVIIYEYKNVLVLNNNDYFGDNAIENHTIRNATVIAEEDIEAAYLPNKLYYTQIASLKTLVLEKKISKLHSNFFFNKINYSKFAKKYYKLFINEKYSKGDILFNEGERIKYLYFVQEGNVQLYTSKSMNEIEHLINILIEKKTENKKEEKDNYYTYSQLNSDHDDFIKYINQKQKNKLIILNNNEDVGTVSYYLGSNYLCSCNIVSNYAKIYKIETKHIKDMLHHEYDCKVELFKRMKKKLGLLSERLYKINNIKLIKTDEIINLEKINKLKIEEERQKLIDRTNYANNTNNNKALVNYDKINDFFSENNNNSINISKIKAKNDSLNLPLLNSNKKNVINYSFFNDNNDELNNSKIYKKNKNRLSYNITTGFNMNKKINKLNMENVYENKIIKRINKDIKYYTENKYSFTKKNKKLNNSLYDNKNNQTLKSQNKNDEKNLSYISNNNSNKTTKIEDKENLNNSIVNTVSTSTQVIKKININKSSDKSSKIPSIYKNNNNNLRTLSNFKNLKTLNLFESKIKNKKRVKYNCPYFEPITLLKKEKYKIFDSSEQNKLFQNELLKIHNKRIIDLKNLHHTMKNSPKFINDIIN